MAGVDSIAAQGNPQLTGHVTVSEGSGITLTQVGQDIEIALGALTTSAEETAGAVTATSLGTTITSNGAANTKGNYAQLIAATANDADGFIVEFTRSNVANQSFLVDLATGGAGAEVVLVANMMMRADELGNVGYSFYVPKAIAAGTRLAMRCQDSNGGSSIIGEVLLVRGGLAERLTCATVATYGAETGDSTGTGVDPNDTANTKGTWAQITAATSSEIDAIAVIAGCSSAPAGNLDLLYDIGTGAAAAETVVVANLALQYRASQKNVSPVAFSPLPLSIPAGTRIAMRAQCGSASQSAFCDFIILGFGP